jgi:uncharacterized repeat protein (TIGR01451 family)
MSVKKFANLISLMCLSLVIPTLLIISLAGGKGGVTDALAQGGTGVIYVATTGTDFAGCGSAGSPCQTMQFAVNQASPGDEIRVSAGTYREAFYIDDNAGKNAIKLIGTGSSSTIIDGENVRGPLINLINQNSGTMVRGFTLKRGISSEGAGIRLYKSSAVLQDLIVQDNSANYGGGIYIRGGSPTLENVTIRDNQAYRAGLFVYDNSSPTMRNITVTGNTSTGCCGVGISIGGSSGSIENALIENNQTQLGSTLGGGAYLSQSSTTIKNSVVRGNKANYGGGLYLAQQSAVLIENTVIENNAVTSEGGGLTITGNQSYVNTSQLRNVTIQDNSAGWGGGVYIQFGATPSMSGTIIQTNTATYGGGLFFEKAAPTLEQITVRGNHATGIGGGLFIEFASSMTLKNSIVRDNSADNWGGGIAIARNDSSPTIVNNFVYNNTAPEGAGIDHETWTPGTNYPNGAPVQPRSIPTKLYHNTIVDNSSDGIHCRQAPTNDIIMTNLILWGNGDDVKDCAVDPTYSIIEQGTFGEPTNSSNTPSFADRAAGDLHLTAGSEGVNDGATTLGITDDIDGQLRDTAPDMGADEALTDLSITKTGSRSDSNVTFVISFSNVGSLLATGVRLTDTVPLSLTNLNIQSSGATITQTGIPPNYVWQVQDLGLNQGGVITLSGTYTGEDDIVNTASIGGDSSEFNTANNTSTATAGTPIYLPIIMKNN